MKICALASGSSGNSFYVESKKNQGILIDCGISAKQIQERLSTINKSPDNLRAIFITHEHSDHIRGLDVLARKFNLNIFVPNKIIKEKFLCSRKELINGIKNDETLKIAGLEVTAFPKSHKSLDPVSYFITEDNKKLSVITDAGHACNNIIEHVSDSHFLAIESNYDEKMLVEGHYPWPTKQWIKSDVGHLSNTQSASCVLEHASKKLKSILLSHISQNNNTPEKALETFNYFMSQRLDIKPIIELSLRTHPTEFFKV
jgi:phosphoribosyl 1,2-cyclic phosphodiesterase